MDLPELATEGKSSHVEDHNTLREILSDLIYKVEALEKALSTKADNIIAQELSSISGKKLLSIDNSLDYLATSKESSLTCASRYHSALEYVDDKIAHVHETINAKASLSDFEAFKEALPTTVVEKVDWNAVASRLAQTALFVLYMSKVKNDIEEKTPKTTTDSLSSLYDLTFANTRHDIFTLSKEKASKEDLAKESTRILTELDALYTHLVEGYTARNATDQKYWNWKKIEDTNLFLRKRYNIVEFRGSLVNDSSKVEAILTLPAECRPQYTFTFPVVCYSELEPSMGIINISPSGEVFFDPTAANVGEIVFDSIRFSTKV